MIKRFISAFLLFGAVACFTAPAHAIPFADYAYLAARHGKTSALYDYIAKGYSIDAVNPDGMTALCQAVISKDSRAYQRLKALGASSNVDCMNRIDAKTRAAYDRGYVQATAPVSSANSTISSSDTATYAAIGLLAAGGVAAAVAIADNDGHSHKSHKTCPVGTHLVGDTCVADHNCVEGERWDGTKCVPMDCPAGTHLVGSECVPIDTCPTGQQMVDNVCVPIECNEGYHLEGDACVMDNPDCPTGQRKEGDVCVPIICPENTHLAGNDCVADENINIDHSGDDDLIGIGSDAEDVFNLLSTPRYPNSESSILLQNNGNGDVYGVYGYRGEVFNSYVVGYNSQGNKNKKPIGTGNITITDNGSGTVYGMYSHISDITQYKEAINASGHNDGTAYGNINITHTGGDTYGLLGDVRAYNTFSSYGGNAYGNINIDGTDGNTYGIYGYVAATNGLTPFYGNVAEGKINLTQHGTGNVFGMAISKDDIPGAGAGGGELESWFAFNAYAQSGVVEGDINIRNFGNGYAYGMFGGRQLYNAMSYGGKTEEGEYTSHAIGRINILNAGRDAYGMYLPDEDEKGILANVNENNSESYIDIVNVSNHAATGLRGGRKTKMINSGEININNLKGGTAVGIYGEQNSIIENSGKINIYRQNFTDEKDGTTYVADGTIGGRAYGIYAESGAEVNNSGTITITGAAEGAGIYIESGATLVNTGVVNFNGGDGRIVENGEHIDIYAIGSSPLSTDVDLNNLGGGEIVLGKGGQFFADSLSGDMSVAEQTVLGSFEDEYTLSEALQAQNTEGLKLASKSALFEANKQQNNSGGYDVVLTRKDFNSVVEDKSVAQFLEDNYAAENNVELYDSLKTANSTQAVNRAAANFAGIDIMPSFRQEDALVYRRLSRQFNDSLFNRPEEHYLGGYKYIDVSLDRDGTLEGSDGKAHAAYGMVKGQSESGITYGLGATIAQLKTDYDNGSNRKSNLFGLWLPVGYDFHNGTKWFSKLYAGYEDGSYDRKTALGKYSSDLNSYQYGLSNELRHDIGLGGGFKLSPVAELNLLGIYQDGFDEGNKANAIHSDSYNSLSLEGGLGAYLSKEFAFNDDNKLGIQIGGIYYVEFLDPDDGTDATIRGMNNKYKISHKFDDDHAALSARVNYKYKNVLLYGELEKDTGNSKAFTIDAGLQYNL